MGTPVHRAVDLTRKKRIFYVWALSRFRELHAVANIRGILQYILIECKF